MSPDGGHLVWQLGNFTEIYTDQSLYNSFDAIVSVFFIDVPGDVVTTVDIFSKILKPGGLLINLGPLHYHDDHVVHYSYDEVEIILDIYGFSKHRFGVEVISGTYCGDDEMNMKPEYYSVPFAVYEKR